jgi:mono/diheme cytochrome c family protein/uncharacterized cupredoxin-like copper-binding protein
VSDERTGRELELSRADRELAGRTPAESSVERFYAGDSAHTVGLTEERAAEIVRQSGSARAVAFLVVLLLVLFVPLYWFYDLGVPALAGTSRLEKEKEVQQVTDISRGYALYLANCARCHGENGEGGIGPPLNDQAKLYNAVTATGQAGTGHLNANYIHNVLTVGGRYVCGDPKSLMPVWSDENGGPLNYRQIDELIAFLVASKDVTFTYQPEHPEAGETLPPPRQQSGWRDPNYQPPADAPSPPPCWRAPNGVLGGASGGSPSASAGPIDDPGTAASPRPIQVVETADLRITDDAGQALPAIPVKAGEVVTFTVDNQAGFPHNFYVGDPAALEANQTAGLEGVPEFASGTQEFTYTVPEDAAGGLQFACTLPGHYNTMHGDLQVQP